MSAGPPTIACSCGDPVIEAQYGGARVLLDPPPVEDGAYVLSLRLGVVLARGIDQVEDKTRRRWSSHACPPTPEVPPDPRYPESFVAIDFETADPQRDSACSLGLVRVESEQIKAQMHWFIKPPRKIANSHIHGIRWEHVAEAPVFAQVWEDALPFLEGISYLVAHGFVFERSVLNTSVPDKVPNYPWIDTVAIAKKTWPTLANHKLSTLAEHLAIPLKHHDALSDTIASAKILIAARRLRPWDWRAEITGAKPGRLL